MTRPDYYEDPQFSGFPVISVDWFQAAAFCSWDGKRLPSEAEWEKAARGHMDTRIYPWGNRADSCDLLNFWGPNGYCVGDTVRVGSYPAGASVFGVMDMAGNVWEWVADWFDPAYYSTYPPAAWPVDPPGPASGSYKAVRSGSWDKDYYSVRATRRQWSVPEGWDRSSGFRCAR